MHFQEDRDVLSRHRPDLKSPCWSLNNAHSFPLALAWFDLMSYGDSRCKCVQQSLSCVIWKDAVYLAAGDRMEWWQNVCVCICACEQADESGSTVGSRLEGPSGTHHVKTVLASLSISQSTQTHTPSHTKNVLDQVGYGLYADPGLTDESNIAVQKLSYRE